MKSPFSKLLMLGTAGALFASPSCILDQSDLVVKEKVCVNFDVNQTTGTFSSFVVCDQFAEAINDELTKHDVSRREVKSIHMVGGTFKTSSIMNHDWLVTADVDIARQDVPGGSYEDGPASFTSFENQSLAALRGQPTDADLNADGVELVNRALEAAVAGDEPRLVLLINNEDVEPTPSSEDPLVFMLRTCVEFQMVIKKNTGKK